ncbi:MAG: hypothetical protein AB7K24_05700 [Gemmataceae bacterium]
MIPGGTPEFITGQPIKAADLNRIAQTVERGSKITGWGGLEVQLGPTGVHLAYDEPRPIVALIESGSNPYSWTQQQPVNGGSWNDYLIAGSAAHNPAYEINGREDVATGTVVVLWPGIMGANGLEWYFDAAGALTTSGPPTFTQPVTIDTSTGSEPPLTLAPPEGQPHLLLKDYTTSQLIAAPPSGQQALYVRDHELMLQRPDGTKCCQPCVPTTGLLDDGTLLIHLPLGEESSGQRQDASGNGYHFTPQHGDNALAYDDSPFIDGTTAAYNGNDSQLLSDNAAIASGGGDWSATMLVRIDQDDIGGDYSNSIFSWPNVGQLNRANPLTINRFSLADGFGNAAQSTVAVNLDANYLVYIGYDDTAGALQISVNGETIVTASAHASYAPGTGPITLFQSQTSGFGYWSGWLQQVIVRTGAGALLTQQQVSDLYNHGMFRQSPGCGQLPATSISQTAVTQHQEALTVTVAQISDFAHASTHLRSGTDEIDGDRLDIDWNPANYTPDGSPTEAGNSDHLTAHLKGIDTALGPASVVGVAAYNTNTVTHTSTGNWQTVTWDAERFDTNSLHSTASNTSRITFDRAGKWLVIGTVYWSDGNTTGDRGLRIIKNGSTSPQFGSDFGNASSKIVHTAFAFMSVAANDYVELQAYQNSGGNRNMFTSALGDGFVAIFMGT